MILCIDNYDSFTYNLVQQIDTHNVQICRNDDPEIFSLAAQADALILSPGPGHPKEAGALEEIIQTFYQTKPILGICLGHQAIAEVFGATIVSAPKILHGKQSQIICEDSVLYQQTPMQQLVMRYHSLIVDPTQLTDEVKVIAATTDGLIMGIEHRDYPIFGIQYHPESIGTPYGKDLIDNFCRLIA